MPDYSALVVEHFEHPRNSGRFAPAADVIEGAAGRSADGTQFVLTARIHNNVIAEARFQAFGCPHSIAAASWLSERIVGLTQAELMQWQWREVAQALDVPTEKGGKLLILEDAAQGLGRQWLRRFPGTM